MKNLIAELDKEFPESMAHLSAAENHQLNMMKNDMNQKQADRFAENEGEVDQLSQLCFKPKSDQFPREEFHGKKINAEPKRVSIVKAINPKWVSYNFGRVFEGILRAFPNQFMHVPVGSSTDDMTPQELLTIGNSVFIKAWHHVYTFVVW